ncbi:MAG: HAD hydrolase-like protein [Planctomycetaceae bacterium]|nr:HAD hydrolase-like protein [Planctomycetales bacterium]MCB9874877.1 HAD hydrolase-like protein [Planctomycetaceae bacterium]MCB9939144.1 HAD hydrolase-like protein [Planctomycetaceae bacterium]HRX77750.1 HAD family hydrolase [Pirellulaceae bacterium]
MLTLLFDIDGTLINTGGAGGTALIEAFREDFGIRSPANVPFSGRTDRGIGTNLFEEHGIDDSPENWQRLRDGYIARLPVHLPQRDGRVLAGVLRLLEQLQAREAVAVGLLTGNLQDGARIKLGYFGLFEYFKFGGFGDDHRNRDGVAQAALTAAEQHANGSFDPNRVWVIGDTPLDISCARAINAKVLAVATGLHPTQELAESQPDRLLEDLSDTNVVLNALS